jgi:hypothetical protein
MPVTTASGNCAGTLTGSLPEGVGDGWPDGALADGLSPAEADPAEEGTGLGARLMHPASRGRRTRSEAARLTGVMRTALS